MQSGSNVCGKSEWQCDASIVAATLGTGSGTKDWPPPVRTCIVHQVIYTSPIECCGCFLGCGFKRGRLPAQVQRQQQHSPSTMLLTDGLHRLWRARALSCTAASHRGSPQIGMLCFSR